MTSILLYSDTSAGRYYVRTVATLDRSPLGITEPSEMWLITIPVSQKVFSRLRWKATTKKSQEFVKLLLYKIKESHGPFARFGSWLSAR